MCTNMYTQKNMHTYANANIRGACLEHALIRVKPIQLKDLTYQLNIYQVKKSTSLRELWNNFANICATN